MANFIERKGRVRKMKPVTMSLLLAVLIGLASIMSSQLGNAKTATIIGNDVSAEQLRPEVVEDFEKDNGWKIVPTPYDPTFVNSRVDQNIVNGKPGDLNDTPAKKIYGVRFQFKYPGYNFVTIFPPVLKDKDGKDVVDPVTRETIGPAIPLNGVVKKVSVWVMSQGKKYILEGYLRDWKGNTHRIIFKHRGLNGRMNPDLNFIGWRPMVAEVPIDLPQQITSYPKFKTLKFIKFIVRATPHTSTEPVYLFFDNLKILTNRFDVHFDGAEINTNWGKGLTKTDQIINKPNQ